MTLHLKEDAYELATEKKLTDLIKQYSEFIQFPIRSAVMLFDMALVDFDDATFECLTKDQMDRANLSIDSKPKKVIEQCKPVHSRFNQLDSDDYCQLAITEMLL